MNLFFPIIQISSNKQKLYVLLNFIWLKLYKSLIKSRMVFMMFKVTPLIIDFLIFTMNLISLSTSKGDLEDNSDRHAYYNPRISLNELMSTSDNIIVTSACLASPLNKWNIEDEHYQQAFRTLLKWMAQNKHRCFLEIQYHNCPNQIEYNKKIYFYSQRTGIPLIAGTDTHSSSQYKAECRKILQIYKVSFCGEEDEFDLVWKTYD